MEFTGAKQVGDIVIVSLNSGEELEADLLLVAVGRGPNTTGHGYEEAGLDIDRGQFRRHRSAAAHQPLRGVCRG